jgi:hypothetical protein
MARFMGIKIPGFGASKPRKKKTSADWAAEAEASKAKAAALKDGPKLNAALKQAAHAKKATMALARGLKTPEARADAAMARAQYAAVKAAHMQHRETVKALSPKRKSG